MFGTSRRQVLAMALAMPFLADPVPRGGKCRELTIKGRSVKICPPPTDEHALVLDETVFIDGVPLRAMVMPGGFSSALNQHVIHPTLLSMVTEAVHLLRGARLVNPRPLAPVELAHPDVAGRAGGRNAGRLRKHAAALTAAERTTLVNAFLELKRSGAYDFFVDVHRRAFDNHGWNAHMHAGFLAWHRAYLLLFENQLGTALPYWDWSTQQRPDATPFTPDFLGGNGRPGDTQVMDGPFAYRTGQWPITVSEDDRNFLRREFGAQADRPSGPSVVDRALAMDVYDRPPYDSSAEGFRNLVEGWPGGPQMHNRAHVWVGGNMLGASSPNDPAFFLNHCFVDKLWADWQARHPSAAHFLPAELLDVPLEPFRSESGWTITPRELLDHRKWYTYGGAPAL
ncbi:tyrosinase family protein [Nonomuraea typhae]|uniref:tyrosinase family protein n=1 Tax=Nonomuraea typhae TaxID=2603600 RepID=UPI001C686B10|nr:tyrosinase family protein [Nonomuraea typhae]